MVKQDQILINFQNNPARKTIKKYFFNLKDIAKSTREPYLIYICFTTVLVQS